MPTRDLVLKYLQDLEHQQQKVTSEEDKPDGPSQGTLHISVGYLDNKQVLEVSVMQARNLPGKGKLHHTWNHQNVQSEIVLLITSFIMLI